MFCSEKAGKADFRACSGLFWPADSWASCSTGDLQEWGTRDRLPHSRQGGGRFTARTAHRVKTTEVRPVLRGSESYRSLPHIGYKNTSIVPPKTPVLNMDDITNCRTVILSLPITENNTLHLSDFIPVHEHIIENCNVLAFITILLPHIPPFSLRKI